MTWVLFSIELSWPCHSSRKDQLCNHQFFITITKCFTQATYRQEVYLVSSLGGAEWSHWFGPQWGWHMATHHDGAHVGENSPMSSQEQKEQTCILQYLPRIQPQWSKDLLHAPPSKGPYLPSLQSQWALREPLLYTQTTATVSMLHFQFFTLCSLSIVSKISFSI